MDSWNSLLESLIFQNAATTVGLILAVLLMRSLVVRTLLRRENLPPEVLRRWLVHSRNLALAVIVFGTLIIWGPQLRAFAVSIAAFAVAFVIAARDLILCLSGTVYRASGSAMRIGDRIQLAGVRGDVVDQNLLSTTILEVGQTSGRYTGRAVVLPNSLLLTTPVFTETYMQEYGFHLVNVPLAKTDDWQQAERKLLEAARQECAPFMEAARVHIDQVRRAHGMNPVNVDPQVSIHLPEPGRINLTLRVPVRVRESGKVEQGIIRRFLELPAAAAA